MRCSHFNPGVLGCAIVLAAFAAACSTPANEPGSATIDTLGDSSEVGASDASAGKVRKLDLLVVLDHSGSMARKQDSLTTAWDPFVKTLNASGLVDLQVAVVTVQQIADGGNPSESMVPKIGAFIRRAATAFTPAADAGWRAPCLPTTNGTQFEPSEECRDGFEFALTAGKNYSPPATSLTALQADGLGWGDGVVKFVNPYAGPIDSASTNLWYCRPMGSPSGVVYPNGSAASFCGRRCMTDAECAEAFDGGTMCYGGEPPDHPGYCVVQMRTSDCPDSDQMSAVLHGDTLKYLHCIATPGVSVTTRAQFEGGMRAAWMALDPAGPNCTDPANCQYKQLVREDATLAILFISDDDDCSVALKYSLASQTPEEVAAFHGLLPDEDQGMCQLLGDAEGKNQALNEGRCLYSKSKAADPGAYKCPSDCLPSDATCLTAAAANVAANARVDKRFAPVSEFAAKLASLKSDPEQVVVAVLTGDSPVADHAGGKALANDPQSAVDRSQFYRATWPAAPGGAPYICASSTGAAGYGARYFELAAAFGANGWAGNICADDLGAPLLDLAAFLAAKGE